MHKRVGAVVLAAGESKRMGRPKQLIRWRGRPLIEHVTRQALDAALDPVVVVIGYRAGEMRAALDRLPVTIVYNPHWPEGMSTSMQAGLARLANDVAAAIFLLVDQPRIDADHIGAMMAAYHACGKPIIASAFGDRRSSPTLFDRSLFDLLMQVKGDSGGRAIIQSHPEFVARVEVNDESILADVDTPQALARELKDESE